MKNIHFSLLTFLIAALICGTAQAKTNRVVRLSDYGIKPGTDDGRLTSRLDSVLALIKASQRPGETITLKFKRGRYDFHAADAKKRVIYISNHDQDAFKHVGIFLKDWQGLTIDGGGADFVFHGRIIPIALQNTMQVTLKRFSVDFEKPQEGQAEIISSSATEGIIFRLTEGPDYRITPEGRLQFCGEGWTNTPVGGIAFDSATHHILYNTADLGFANEQIKDLGNRKFHAPKWCDTRLVPGTRMALRSWARPCPGLFMDECRQTKISDVKIHFAEGMGLVAQRCTDIDLSRFGVCLRKGSPRYYTTQADATHFSQCRGLIRSVDGLYEGMMDDAINVHGVYLRVRERIDDNTLRCRFEHGQAWGFAWGDKGDTVCFVRSKTMEHVDGTNVIAEIKPADKPQVTGCREFIIRFVKPVAAEVTAAEGYGVENLTWTPEVEFSGNVIRNNRARGALFSSPRRTICERNLFDHTSGSAIVLCGDCNGWYESGAVRDLVIRKNVFINALTSLYQFTNAVISIYPEIPGFGEQQRYFHGGTPTAISITDNVFDTFDKPVLYAKSVDGLVFKNNKITHNNAFKPFHFNNQTIKLERCIHTDIQVVE